MKIAHVTATFPPYWAGTGNVVAQTARTLAGRGHDVTVFTPRVAGPIEPPDDWPFETRRLPAPLRVGNAAWTPALARVLSGFDVIHLHYPYIGGAELAARAAGRLQVPLVLTYHNRLVSGGPLRRAAFRAYSRLVEPHVLNAADIVVAVHEDYRRAWFAARPRVTAVPHGIDAGVFRPQDRFKSRAMLGLGTEERVVLFVGALDRAHRFKNVDGLLDALSRCTLPLTAVLVGDGDLVPDLKTQARRLGIAGSVRFVGSRRPEQLPAFYSAADLTVLPSVNTESFGLVLVESLACATPVIATALPGVRGVVGEAGEGGWVVPPGDVEALAQALQKAFRRTAAERHQMGERGRTRVLREMTWDRVAERLEGLYQEAAASAAVRARHGIGRNRQQGTGGSNLKQL